MFDTDSAEIENSQFEKLLGDTIDSQLCFEKHINSKVKQNLNLVSYLGQFFPWISTKTKC